MYTQSPHFIAFVVDISWSLLGFGAQRLLISFVNDSAIVSCWSKKWLHLSCWHCSTLRQHKCNSSKQAVSSCISLSWFFYGGNMQNNVFWALEGSCVVAVFMEITDAAPKWQSALLCYYQVCTFSYGLSVQSMFSFGRFLKQCWPCLLLVLTENT